MMAMGARTPGVQYWFGTIQPFRPLAQWTKLSRILTPFSLRILRAHLRGPSERSMPPSVFSIDETNSRPNRALRMESSTRSKPSVFQTGEPETPSSAGVRSPESRQSHEPGEDASEGDAVESAGVGGRVERFGGPLVENAAKRTQALVGLVILLELAPHLLADGRAGLAAGSLPLRDDGFLR